tara:strand:- start:185 stop:490 length:306 start_codon:yes stop_codon:yes gene_type:complete
MPYIAIGDGKGTVATKHACDTATTTDKCSTTVFVEDIGVVRAGDDNTSHTFPPTDSCPSHTVALSSYSESVRADGEWIGRVGDFYGLEEITVAGQATVSSG